ncbi:MAG: hypothetical protein H0V49_10430 [Nocardioidaceae bacterium]|nr:hypothetical protein [Nocardioidaceae bacterium]
MKACDVRRATVATLWTFGLTVLIAGCPGGRSSPDDISDSPRASFSSDSEGGRDGAEFRDVRANIVQQRIDEGTRRIGMRVSAAKTSLHVVGVQLRSAGFQTLPATSKDTLIAPGRVIDLSTTYGAARCEGEDPAEGLSAVLTLVDSAGSSRAIEVPVTGHGVGLIRRLHDAECAHRQLSQAASISYSDFTRDRIDGEEVLAGALELERADNGSSGEVVLVKSLAGSVLFDFRPLARGEPGVFARLAAGSQHTRLQVVIGSSGRCDQHARSQSTQTFLFSAFVRVGSAVQHREIVVPPPQLRRQALALLNAVC